MTKVKATVISQKGHCGASHKLGDEVVFDWDINEITGKICLHALYSALPKIYAMAHGGSVAFSRAADGTRVATHACPDGYNPVILEIKRID